MNIDRTIRQDVINAYDDSNGVNASCHRILVDTCLLYGWSDIQDKVDLVSNGDGYRFYLGENDAEDLRNVPDEPNMLLTPVSVGGGGETPLDSPQI